MTWEFAARWFSIVVLDLSLAGDNAVVIAMAVRSLPARHQRQGLFWGAFGAVTFRGVVTFVAARLLQMPFLQLGGGVLLIWIAWKLLRQPPGKEGGHLHPGASLVEAIKIIIVADFIMSTDNMLAVAAASHGSILLLLFGFGLSIPVIFFCSAVVASVMNRYPWLVLLGAAILGWVAGEMMVGDRLVSAQIGSAVRPAAWVVPVVLALAVVVVGRWRELMGQIQTWRYAAAHRHRGQ